LKHTRANVATLGLIVLLSAVLAGCPAQRKTPAWVTVYTSLDEPYSRPILDAFSKDTGIEVRPVYDTEANKSRGLAQRILAEKNRPQADVWWSSEVMQTLTLRQDGMLESYRSPAARGIPERFRDADGYWTGFAGRFRVLAHRKGLKDPPHSLLELADSRWKGEVTMAQPLFGTTTTEVAALFQLLGAERAEAYYRERKENGTRVVDGNSVAVELVSRGDAQVAQTDTDDAYSRIDRGAPLEVVFPDQQGPGALLIPNTVALVRGGPNAEGGRKLVDYLLRPETELSLAALPSRQLPLHAGLTDRLPKKVRPLADVKVMDVDYRRLPEVREEVDKFLREVFLR
jgi:iron(III) transport system substrate-binding protein